MSKVTEIRTITIQINKKAVPYEYCQSKKINAHDFGYSMQKLKKKLKLLVIKPI
jgi:predicted transcriptional regulator